MFKISMYIFDNMKTKAEKAMILLDLEHILINVYRINFIGNNVKIIHENSGFTAEITADCHPIDFMRAYNFRLNHYAAWRKNDNIIMDWIQD